MKKYTFSLISLLIACSLSNVPSIYIQTTSPSLCKETEEYFTPSGCWTSCTSSQFNQCGDVFPALYNPSFCAYTKDGRYVSYTYSCQACKSPDVVAVRNGACSCDFIKCNSDQICKDGQCVKIHPIDPVDLCSNIKCQIGYKCIKGQCVCNNISDSCLNVQCDSGYTCRNGFCVRNLLMIDPCQVLRCPYGCANGKCLNNMEDLCSRVKCRQGFYCQKGVCLPQPGLCGVVICEPNLICRNGQCVDPNIDWACAAIRCDSSNGYYCKNGTCVRDCNALKVQCSTPRPTNNNCPILYYIVAPQQKICGVTSSGQLINYVRQCQACKNHQVKYYWNKKCEDLVGCQKPECKCDNDCQEGLSCQNGLCINKCLTVKCSAGYHCQKGKCVVDIQPQCRYDNDCPNEFSCEVGKCINKCMTVKCASGYHCHKGQCIKNHHIDILPNNTDVDWACAAIRCDSSNGYYCKNGSCIRDCNAIKVQCTKPRPNELTCPTLQYFVKPEPTVCGITYTGQQIGYPRQCDACKDKSVEYYWNKRCEDLIGCQRPRCKCDGDCSNGFSCESGSCVNKCLNVKCYPGSYCFKGTCIANIIVDKPVDGCELVLCPEGKKCVNGKCLNIISPPYRDLCQGIVCIATTRCIDGVCVPLDENSYRV